jgi:hypothetical protein
MRGMILTLMTLLFLLVTGVSAQRVVDTRQFGLIQLGMTMFEVQRRLGPPTDAQYGSVLVSQAANFVLIPSVKARWFYRGNDRVPDTEITFINGKVANKERISQ